MDEIVQYIKLLIDKVTSKKAVDDAEKTGEEAGKAAATGLNRGMAKAVAIGTIVAHAFEKAAEKVAEFTLELLHAAVETQQVAIEFNNVFGAASGEMEKFVQSFAPQAGIAQLELRKLLAITGSLAVGMGDTREQAAKFGEQVARLAGDIMAFHPGISMVQSFEAIQGALVGITRPMHNLGILVSAANIEMKALADTGKKAAGDLTALEKANATLSVIYTLMGPQLGALERSQGTMNLTVRRAQAAFEDLKNQLGAEMAPALKDLLTLWTQNREAVLAFATTLGRVIVGGFDVVVSIVFGLASGFAKVAEGIYGASAGLDSWNASVQEFFGRGDLAKKLREEAEMFHKLSGEMKKNAEEWSKISQSSGRAAFGQPRRLPAEHGSSAVAGGGLGDSPEQKAAAADAALQKEIGSLTAVIQLEDESEAAVHAKARAMERLLEIQDQLQQDAEAEVGTLDEQIVRLERLHRIREAIHKQASTDFADQIKTAEHIKDNTERFRALLEIRQKINEAPVRSEEELKKQQEQLDQINTSISHMQPADVIAGMFEDAVDGAHHFVEALKLIRAGVLDVNDVMAVFGKGGAASLARELTKIAKMKVLENVAEGFENLWRAWKASASALTAPLVPIYAHAAAGAFLAAGKWALVAGGTGAIAGRAGAPGGGAGGSAPGRSGGAAVDANAKQGPDIHVYLHAIDTHNPEDQRVIGEMSEKYRETYGGEIIYHRS